MTSVVRDSQINLMQCLRDLKAVIQFDNEL